MSLLSTTTTTTTKHPPPLILKSGHYQIGSVQSSFEVQKLFYLMAFVFKYVLSFKVNPTDLQMKRIQQQGNYDFFFLSSSLFKFDFFNKFKWFIKFYIIILNLLHVVSQNVFSGQIFRFDCVFYIWMIVF